MVEINIISRDTIKPSLPSPSLRHLSPFKLSFIDQLTGATYSPLILFYTISDHPTKSSSNLPETLARLKSSLSETLTLYYPFSGRVKNNLYIHDFDAGIPFLEAHVNCRMLEFLKLKDMEVLNRFLPLQPLHRETEDASLLPLIAFQVSVFTCGGIAIGVSLNHKLCDGITANSILESWAAISSGKRDKIIYPDSSQASSLIFPPRTDLLPKRNLDIANSFRFSKSNNVTRRFVFSVNAIATLQANSRNKNVPNPTRIEALTSFIWKHATAASRALSPAGTSSPRTSMICQAVNLRPQMKQQMSSANFLGNFILLATAVADSSKIKEAQGLCDLVNLINESVKRFDANYIESLQGDDGFGAICEYYNQLELLFSSKPPPEVYIFTAWTNIFNELDFGWGKPCWRGLMGKSGPESGNLTFFMKGPGGKEVEAWVTLEENHMAMLEKDPKFLAFASPNPGISSM